MNMRYWLNTLRAMKIYDLGTVHELQTFVRYPNGTWKGKPGTSIYDDKVMSLVWALFVLEQSICERYYEIVSYDEQGKPLKLRAYTVESPSIFKLDEFYQRDAQAPMPSFIGMSPNMGTIGGLNTESDLTNGGWSRLEQVSN